jgi:hypothetical protein
MSFDLNIDNYTRDELIQMFELPTQFDKNIVEIKEAKLREGIINNVEISKETQSNTIKFLLKAKNIILKDNVRNPDDEFRKVSYALYHHDYQNLKPIELKDESQDHMIQNKVPPPYISTGVSEFYPGVINPVSKRVTKKNLNIDSRFRDNYYSTSASNYNITLPMVINNVIQMSLSAIELPLTYYVISKQYGNNFFSIKVTWNGTDYSTVIKIPEGNYSSATIVYIITQELIYAGAPFSNVAFDVDIRNSTTNSNPFSVSTGTGSGKTLVGFANANFTGYTYLELNFQADEFGNDDRNTQLPLKLGWILGFRNGIYTNNLNYVSEGICDVKGSKYLFLVLDDYHNNVNNSFYSAFNSSLLNKNILARISLENSAINNTFQNTLKIVGSKREYYGPVNIQNMTVQLLDDYGRIIDLNNMDYSFCLSMDIVYDI